MVLRSTVLIACFLVWSPVASAHSSVRLPPCVDTPAERERLVAVAVTVENGTDVRVEALQALEQCATLGEIEALLPELEAMLPAGPVPAVVKRLRAKVDVARLDDQAALARLRECLTAEAARQSGDREHWALEELMRRGDVAARDAIHQAFRRDYRMEYSEIAAYIDPWLSIAHGGLPAVVTALDSPETQIQLWAIRWLVQANTPDAWAGLEGFVTRRLAECHELNAREDWAGFTNWNARWQRVLREAVDYLEGRPGVSPNIGARCLF